jgi:cytochrome c551/c552
VAWNYPSFLDCVGCHSAAVGTIGPETDQMNRVVDGGNQIDTFVALGLFDDTAPTAPYAAPLVEPYANAALGLAGPPAGATLEQQARSYLAANCAFCHRPDVNDQGFDLRYALSLHDTGICNLAQQNGIPGMTGTALVDFAPGDHASSAMWIRMGIAVPSSDPGEVTDVGRMPPVASFAVDPQATALIGQWIDSVTSCPGADAGP